MNDAVISDQPEHFPGYAHLSDLAERTGVDPSTWSRRRKDWGADVDSFVHRGRVYVRLADIQKKYYSHPQLAGIAQKLV